MFWWRSGYVPGRYHCCKIFRPKKFQDVASVWVGYTNVIITLFFLTAYRDVVASSAAGEESLVAFASGKGTQAVRPQIMSVIPGQYAGPVLLDFGEGKVKPLAESAGALRIELCDSLEHTVPVQESLNDGAQRERVSTKRTLQVGANSPVRKRRRAECVQNLGVGGDGGSATFSQGTSNIGVGSVVPDETLQGSPRYSLGPTSSNAFQAAVQDIEGTRADVTPVESMNGQAVLQSRSHGQQVPAIVEGSLSSRCGADDGNSNIHTAQPQRAGRPTAHSRTARGSGTGRGTMSRNMRQSAELSSDTRNAASAMDSAQSTRPIRARGRGKGRGGARVNGIRTNRSYPANHWPGATSQSASGPAHSIAGTSAEHENVPQRRNRAGPPSEYQQFGPCNCVCRYCHAMFWFEERLSTSTTRRPSTVPQRGTAKES